MQVLVFTSLWTSLLLVSLPPPSLLQRRGMQINIDLENLRGEGGTYLWRRKEMKWCQSERK